jgi:uncharacterized membrane protein (UPF0127 family)
MSFPLDVLFCDREWKVVHVVRSMPRRRVTRFVWRARFAVEMAAGALPASVRAGDRLKLLP